ncbi:BPSS1780 family membrane protein [Halothiobacillus sp. DCM-1]|uniref:BPSS1780 family membrane protein n=1 Tax=Halothiobacillus sp. DCM-1 TaxID=3112558 RepID=UPI003250DFB3
MQKHAVGQGWHWIANGWRLMRERLGLSIGVVLLMYVLLFVVSMLPMVGSMITPFLTPFLAGGVYLVLARIQEIRARRAIEPLAGEQPIGFDLMFSAFSRPALRKPLLLLGALSVVFSLSLLLLMAGFVVWQLAGIDHAVLTDPTASDTARLEFLMPYLLSGKAMLLWLVVMVVAVVYSMATFFAVPLIVLRGFSLGDALKASFAAVSANWLPFLWYALIWALLFITVPLTMMLSLILLMPLLFASLFVAFEAIWPDQPTAPGHSSPPQRVSTVM